MGVDTRKARGAGLARLVAAAVAAWPGIAPAQGPPPPFGVPVGAVEPGRAVVGQPAGPLVPEVVAPALPAGVQVVRFTVPDGVRVEVLGPPPEPVPVAPDGASTTFGLRVGVGYRLRLSDLPDRPGAELFPVVEVVGHLHRPPAIDPSRYPIRVEFTAEDLNDVADHARLVTQVVYLEDPDQALPLNLPRDRVPTVTLSPAEEPLKVASALGRVVAIVRLGARTPSPEEWAGAPGSGLAFAGGRCPFVGPGGGACPLPCGPSVGPTPPPAPGQLPRDEYLCDGGDRGEAARPEGAGGLRGIEPRDAVIRFHDSRAARVLPTNTVCLYAPRFAAVRTSLGASSNLIVQVLQGHETLVHQEMRTARTNPQPIVQNQALRANRHRLRPSSQVGRTLPGAHSEVRILGGTDTINHIAGHVLNEGAETRTNRVKAVQALGRHGAVAIKTAESVVIHGIVEGAGQAVMSWRPVDVTGVETPPERPGLSVVKRVDAEEALPGEVVQFTILYCNMGNVPIGSVSVIDSLLPRLEYVAGSARGPAGAVFTAAPNEAGSTELRWDLPGELAPGAEGLVSFEAKVR